jgi:intracellular septation protein
MKILFDIFPVLLFFAVFKWGESHQDSAQQWVTAFFATVSAAGAITAEVAPVMLATGVAVLASCAQILYLLVRRQKVEPALWVSFIIILVFGGATIYFHSETFIKWKPTVLYWTYAIGLLAGQWLFKKNLIRAAM